MDQPPGSRFCQICNANIDDRGKQAKICGSSKCEKERNHRKYIDNRDKCKTAALQYYYDNRDVILEKGRLERVNNSENHQKILERKRQYRIKNRDKLREKKHEYRIKNRDKLRLYEKTRKRYRYDPEYARRYREINYERIAEQRRQRRASNPDRFRSQRHQHYQNNRDRCIASSCKYKIDHPEQTREYKRMRTNKIRVAKAILKPELVAQLQAIHGPDIEITPAFLVRMLQAAGVPLKEIIQLAQAGELNGTAES